MRSSQDGTAAPLVAGSVLGPWYAAAPRPGPGWVSWATLTDDPVVLRRRVAEVRALLAAGPGSPDLEPRVAASLVHLGLAARLLSPVLGGALVARALPVATTRQVHVHLSGTNPLPMAVTAPTSVPAVGAAMPELLVEHWLLPFVEPLSARVRDEYSLSPRVMQGNVASAVAGGLRGVVTARADLAAPAEGLLTALLRRGPLAGSGRHGADASFVRSSCCLFYRVPGAGTCADCVLALRS